MNWFLTFAAHNKIIPPEISGRSARACTMAQTWRDKHIHSCALCCVERDHYNMYNTYRGSGGWTGKMDAHNAIIKIMISHKNNHADIKILSGTRKKENENDVF
jgi:hypothetical protein